MSKIDVHIKYIDIYMYICISKKGSQSSVIKKHNYMAYQSQWPLHEHMPL